MLRRLLCRAFSLTVVGGFGSLLAIWLMASHPEDSRLFLIESHLFALRASAHLRAS